MSTTAKSTGRSRGPSEPRRRRIRRLARKDRKRLARFREVSKFIRRTGAETMRKASRFQYCVALFPTEDDLRIRWGRERVPMSRYEMSAAEFWWWVGINLAAVFLLYALVTQ